MKLKALIKHFPHLQCRGSKELEITGVSASSKTLVPGNLFIAKKGMSHDGTAFIAEAIAAGASAIVTDMYNPFLDPKVSQLITNDVAGLEADLADVFYGTPSKHLYMVGITGTSGKTTTSYMIRHLFEALQGRCGLIGTIEWILASGAIPSTMTTPDVVTCHKLLSEMKEGGCKACVMEVSSHALTQGRVKNIDYDVAVFTNLSQDHLDYHKDMQQYAEAKALLFTSLAQNKVAVINSDSPWSKVMIEKSKARILSYGIENTSDVKASDVILSETGTEFTVRYENQQSHLSSPLIGVFNVYNLLAATTAGLAKGYRLDAITKALSSFSFVPGRLEKVENRKGLHIFVDYCHKPDALDNVLKTLTALKKGRLLCLFGCGGDRDKGKRPLMGSTAERYADEVIITSDNPRSEDPVAIIKQILSGIQDTSKVLVEIDRKKAIEKVICRMKKDDVLLIAGKGHETYQIFSHGTVEFDDRVVAKKLCE
jgi:UDP-N-acetylmuramoyl-L-alanyl-D-glutamate--2,6-diaminopimelate ligase